MNVTLVKKEETISSVIVKSLTSVQVKEDTTEVRTKNHEFGLNLQKQVQRKIDDADKTMLKVEHNEKNSK